MGSIIDRQLPGMQFRTAYASTWVESGHQLPPFPKVQSSIDKARFAAEWISRSFVSGSADGAQSPEQHAEDNPHHPIITLDELKET